MAGLNQLATASRERFLEAAQAGRALFKRREGEFRERAAQGAVFEPSTVTASRIEICRPKGRQILSA